MAGRSEFGYGAFWLRGYLLGAHVVSHYWAGGHPAEGEFVTHSCDRPECVNPAHLVAASQAQNMHDKATRGRAAAGERHGMAKLTRKQVERIRKMRSEGWLQQDLAEKFGVTQAHVSDLCSGRRGVWGSPSGVRRSHSP